MKWLIYYPRYYLNGYGMSLYKLKSMVSKYICPLSYGTRNELPAPPAAALGNVILLISTVNYYNLLVE